MAFSAHERSTTNDEHVVAPLYDDPYWNGEYFVVLKRMAKHPQMTQERVEVHKRWISGVVDEEDERRGYYLKFPKFDSRMYSGKFSESILDQIRRSPDVEYVAKNGRSWLC